MLHCQAVLAKYLCQCQQMVHSDLVILLSQTAYVFNYSYAVCVRVFISFFFRKFLTGFAACRWGSCARGVGRVLEVVTTDECEVSAGKIDSRVHGWNKTYDCIESESVRWPLLCGADANKRNAG